MRMPLKQLNEMFEPDKRSTSFARFDAAGRHAKTIDDHFADIAALQLSESVPEGIRDEFDTVRNLYLYSWYVYDFTVPAILYAHALIEKAIKEKCCLSAVSIDNTRGLRNLLTTCIDHGWLLNSDFRFALEFTREEIVPAVNDLELPIVRSTLVYHPSGTDYCEHLAEHLPKIRNIGAHGEAGLSVPAHALHQIEICACIINALFRAPNDAATR